MKRHVSKLLLLVPVEDQENSVKDNDVEVEQEVLDYDVDMKDDILDDDVCDSMAQSVASSYNSPDAKKEDKVEEAQEGEVDEESGGN